MSTPTGKTIVRLPYKPAPNTPTPWGMAQRAVEIAPGITAYETASHGGFHLNEVRLAQLHKIHGPIETFCGQPQWFEEDCDWAYVATAFPEYFLEVELQEARASIAYWAREARNERQKRNAARCSHNFAVRTEKGGN